jgi:hypothetical protein
MLASRRKEPPPSSHPFNRVRDIARVMEQPWHLARADEDQALEALLTDFNFVMAKCAANRVQALLQNVRSCKGRSPQWDIWKDTFRVHAHILRRGTEQWPSHKWRPTIILSAALTQRNCYPC